MSARNFGKPQMLRPASSVNSWFTGSWWMNAPRKPRATSAVLVIDDAGSMPLWRTRNATATSWYGPRSLSRYRMKASEHTARPGSGSATSSPEYAMRSCAAAAGTRNEAMCALASRTSTGIVTS